MRHCILTWLVKDTKLKRIAGGLVMAEIVNETVKKTRYLNTLRVLAVTGVIMIHVFSPLNSYFTAALTEQESYFCIVLRNCWQWCVPLFVMISGAIFLDSQKEITAGKILKKYLPRIILALFIFGAPYAFLELFFDARYHFNFSQIGTSVINVFQGKSWDHMWYLYMIAGIYLILPLLKIFVNNCGKKLLGYVMIILFIFTSAAPLAERVFSLNTGFYIPVNSVYVFYLLLGHYIHNYKVTVNKYILFLLSALYYIFALLSPLNKSFIDTSSRVGKIIFFDYDSPIVIMSAFSLFCITRQKNISNKVFDVLSPMCFGIYLIHTLFINFLYKFIKLTPENFPLVIVIIGVSIITIILSIGFTRAARRIKIIREYVL
jgi:surface polysaccharide O-acyltransferase-like enzyme